MIKPRLNEELSFIHTLIWYISFCGISIDCSDFDHKGVAEIGEVLKSFEARRPQLDMLLSKCNDLKGSVVSKGIDAKKNF